MKFSDKLERYHQQRCAEEEIHCPYCGYVQRDIWEYAYDDEESADTECGECEREFTWSRETRHTFTTAPLEDKEE